MESLAGSLGLDQVEANPNFIADGVYLGVVSKSEYTIPKAGSNAGKVCHLLEYKITDQQSKFNGKTESEFYALGDPIREGNELTGITPTMSEGRKSWYKRRLIALGVPETQVTTVAPSALIALKVKVTIGHRNGYQNVTDAALLNSTEASTPVVSTPAVAATTPTGNPDLAGL